jgi:excinuclease UvrABC nuclease subunit
MSCIYGIKDLLMDEIIYVGKALNFNKRKGDYLRPTPSRNHKIITFMRSFDNWEERFEIYKIRSCLPSSLNDLEKYYIHALQPEHNIIKPNYTPIIIFRRRV